MAAPPILLSDIIIQNPDVNSFEGLIAVIRRKAEAGERFFLQMDLKPDYRDTPRDWEFRIEEAFSWGER